MNQKKGERRTMIRYKATSSKFMFSILRFTECLSAVKFQKGLQFWILYHNFPYFSFVLLIKFATCTTYFRNVVPHHEWFSQVLELHRWHRAVLSILEQRHHGRRHARQQNQALAAHLPGQWQDWVGLCGRNCVTLFVVQSSHRLTHVKRPQDAGILAGIYFLGGLSFVFTCWGMFSFWMANDYAGLLATFLCAMIVLNVFGLQVPKICCSISTRKKVDKHHLLKVHRSVMYLRHVIVSNCAFVGFQTRLAFLWASIKTRM